MKYIIILGDGMADWPVKEFGGKTILQNARKPYMDMLARKGRTGMLKTVPDGFHPGSEVANMTVMGYDVTRSFEGRGVLEAANIGVDIKPGQMGMRCNIICIENGLSRTTRQVISPPPRPMSLSRLWTRNWARIRCISIPASSTAICWWWTEAARNLSAPRLMMSPDSRSRTS